jgi:hypothetical protein
MNDTLRNGPKTIGHPIAKCWERWINWPGSADFRRRFSAFIQFALHA